MASKKYINTNLPEPQPELVISIAALQAAVATVEHVKQAVREWPARVAQAESELADVERRLDHAETDRDLASGDTSSIDATIRTLVAEAAERRETLNRLRSRSSHLNERGEAANAELERAKHRVRAERGTYANAVRDALAAPIAETAAILSQYRAQYRELAHAAELSTDWLDRACVPDLRQGAFGGADLLAVSSDASIAALTAMESTLEPLRTAGRLLVTGRFDPRPSIASRT
ncbi:hypothetical protein PQR14_27585 [Paraburkholderia bryophila]|uniref:hypothetical protein n=1 Tax=Paraburkholderia bryophila TaxID=420952 RepID=UPI0038B8DDCF